MPGEKPTFEEYRAWLEATTGEKIDAQTERLFNLNVVAAFSEAQLHPFIKTLDRALESIAQEYEAGKGARLFSDEPELNLLKKSFESALNKSFRLNVIKNRHFPDPPHQEGWLLPKHWFSRMNDLIRCSFVCRYIDGPRYVAERLHSAAQAAGYASKFDPVQLDRGYYAYHFYIGIPTDIPYWVEARTQVWLEIQLTTQLQEIVLDLTHRYYEDIRLKESAEEAWKWEYKSARFKASYLSHTLHLLEGLIAEVREGGSGHGPEHHYPEVAGGGTRLHAEAAQLVEPIAATREDAAAQHASEEHHEHAGHGTAATQAADTTGATPSDDSKAGAGG